MEPEMTASAIREKTIRARTLFDAWGRELAGEPTVSPFLHRLRVAIEANRKVMAEVGIVAECRRCEEEEGGSCCGSGIENRYDVELLLINLLLGVSLAEDAKRPKSCRFLGERGCTLLARHVLCVNYLCAKLRERLSPGQLSLFQASSGEELETEFFLHEAIKTFLSRRAHGTDSPR
ncbi:MAG TPA: hypothetical protein VEI04_08110 [Syntrophobacteria bacterium]|nr:hypothetical protein [Syntrophobacteria bacterium]